MGKQLAVKSFASFMMVEKFGYSVVDISLLFIINYVFNLLFAPKIGKLISRIGERRALTIEYVGLLLVFISYALVDDSRIAVGLYIVDHLFFCYSHRSEDLLSKNSRPKGLCFHRRRQFYYQSHCSSSYPSSTGYRVVKFT